MLKKSLYAVASVLCLALTLPAQARDFNDDDGPSKHERLYEAASYDAHHYRHERDDDRYESRHSRHENARRHHGEYDNDRHVHHHYHVSNEIELLDHLIVSVILR